MRWSLLCSVLLYTLNPSVYSLDTEDHLPIYKFAVVNGEPTTLNESCKYDCANFQECTEKCEEDVECVAAYQLNSSDTCYIFHYGSIGHVTKNESGGEGTTAFKVYTEQPSCDLNSQFLLNGRTYPLYPNDTTQYLWKIDTDENGWTVTYIRSTLNESGVCGNFLYNRPSPDSCSAECNITMVTVNAKPGPLSRDSIVNTTESYEDCVMMCWKNPFCAVASYTLGKKECEWWKFNDIWFLERTEASEGNRMAIKLPLNNDTCKFSTDKLLQGQYYLPLHRIKGTWNAHFFTVNTTKNYYTITVYNNEAVMLVRTIPDCQMNYVGWRSTFGKRIEEQCFSHQVAPNITQSKAKELCELWGGHLMPERFTGFLWRCDSGDNSDGLPWKWRVPLSKWGFMDFKTSILKIWFGLEKDAKTKKWTWTAPQWRLPQGHQVSICSDPEHDKMKSITLNDTITWAPGEPKDLPDYNCAYLRFDFKSPFPGYAFYSAPCNYTDGINGFTCGSAKQSEQGVPTFKSVVDSYGEYGLENMWPYVNNTWY